MDASDRRLLHRVLSPEGSGWPGGVHKAHIERCGSEYWKCGGGARQPVEIFFVLKKMAVRVGGGWYHELWGASVEKEEKKTQNGCVRIHVAPQPYIWLRQSLAAGERRGSGNSGEDSSRVVVASKLSHPTLRPPPTKSLTHSIHSQKYACLHVNQRCRVSGVGTCPGSTLPCSGKRRVCALRLGLFFTCVCV